MQDFNMLLDVVLPIGCALISGGLTVLGVLLTIKHENKKNKETIRLSNKPIFFRIEIKLKIMSTFRIKLLLWINSVKNRFIR